MKWTYILILVSILVLITSFSNLFAGASPEDICSDEELISSYFPLVLVIEVLEVDKSRENTNGDPPLLRIRIVSVIKGNMEQWEAIARWEPPGHGVDWSGEEANRMIQQWSQEANPPPPIHSRWIVAGKLNHDIIQLSTRCRFAFSLEQVYHVRQYLENGDSNP